MEAIVEKVPVGGTFIDVGANIGIHSMLAALRAGREGRVLALEASPVTYPLLVENLSSAGCPGAVAMNVAVWDAHGTVAFSHTPENAGCSHVNPAPHESGRVFTVPCDSLDSLVAGAGLARIDLIKIDVEGSEIRVLRGARKTLSRFKPPIVLEFHAHTLRAYESASVFDLYKAVRDLGYQMKVLCQDGRIIPVTDFGQMEEISCHWQQLLDVLCEHPG